MSKVFDPILTTDNYDSIRAFLGGNMPLTFKEWSYQQQETSLQLAKGGGGIVVKGVEVHLDELRRYVGDNRKGTGRHTLTHFAFYKGRLQCQEK